MASLRSTWDGLDTATQMWLINHNGEPLPDEVRAVVPEGWLGVDGAVVDAVVDWVEAVANGEDPD